MKKKLIIYLIQRLCPNFILIYCNEIETKQRKATFEIIGTMPFKQVLKEVIKTIQ